MPASAPLPGRTVVSLTPGIYLSAAPGSRLKISDPEIDKDGNETGPGAMTLRKAQLQLFEGEICAHLPADDTGSKSHLDIDVGRATASAGEGSLFLVRATQAELRVTCARGAVLITASTGGHTITAGEYATVSQDGNSPSVAIASGPEDVTAQTDLEAALDQESSIRELVQTHASAPAAWLRR